jgi:hypothetical protein
VVGYSRLVRAGEADAPALLGALRGEIIEPNIAKHSGPTVLLNGSLTATLQLNEQELCLRSLGRMVFASPARARP